MALGCVCATDRIAAGLMDDDPVGEGVIMGLDVKCPLLAFESVILDEVHIVHTRNLQTKHTTHVTRNQTPKIGIILMNYYTPSHK